MSINLTAVETGRNFGTAMNRILAGDADAISVWKVSRFSGNWREAAEDVELLLDHDKDLLSEEGFDTASTAGRLPPPPLFALANWEHDRGGDITARPAGARREPQPGVRALREQG